MNNEGHVIGRIEFATRMGYLADELEKEGDLEETHMQMDALMCETLESIGYEEGVRIFKEAPKWYA